jgi:peptidoglycan-N-acetylglucosamine deacetylase
MRAAFALSLLLCVTFSQPALAQVDCASDPTKLGVSRTIVIDGSTGPRFGLKFNETPFLKEGEVVLSFDDGPLRTITKPILEALAAQCTKATFFLIGRSAIADPYTVKEIARRGHTVGSHTWSHANMQKITSAEGEAEIEMGISAVQLALGKPAAAFFRFPYLRHTDDTAAHLRTRKFAAVGIDLDGRDFETKDVPSVMDRLLGDLTTRRKGIILMHDIHTVAVTYVPMLLAELKQRGFKVVHLQSKTAAQTLPQYDAQVLQEAERLRLAALEHARAKQSAPTAKTKSDAAAKSPSAGSRPPARKRTDDVARPATGPGEDIKSP